MNAVNLPLHERAELPGGDPAAAVLRPERRPAAVNYGGIGAVIGHEISHSFDDTGALFDAHGQAAQLVDAGGPGAFQGGRRSARRAVRRLRAACPDLHVNGKQTLGENIADVAGLAAPTTPITRSLARQGSAPPSTASPATSNSSSPSRKAGASTGAPRRCVSS